MRRLMAEHKWPHNTAAQWVGDLLRWLFTAQRWRRENGTPFEMDALTPLDDVWHAYILHTREYLTLSKQLFGVPYLHHDPGDPLAPAPLDPQRFERQLQALAADWGNDYIDRVYAYGVDLYDLSAGPEPTAEHGGHDVEHEHGDRREAGAPVQP